MSLKKFRIYWLHWIISQELQNIVNQFHMNDNQVNTFFIFIFYFFTFLNIDIWHQCIDNVPQDEISRYIVVSIFWHSPKGDHGIVYYTKALSSPSCSPITVFHVSLCLGSFTLLSSRAFCLSLHIGGIGLWIFWKHQRKVICKQILYL